MKPLAKTLEEIDKWRANVHEISARMAAAGQNEQLLRMLLEHIMLVGFELTAQLAQLNETLTVTNPPALQEAS